MIDLVREIKPHFQFDERAIAAESLRCRRSIPTNETFPTLRGATPEITLWSSELAARLRLLQSSFADEPPEIREQVMAEEVDRALATVPLARREACLERIAAEFPSHEGAPAPAPASAAIPDDPFALAERLLQHLPTLTEDQVAALAERLAQSPLAPPARGDSRTPIPEDLQKRIDKLMPNRKAKIDQVRALRMLDTLLDLSANVDQLVWQVWKNIAPKSVIHPEGGRFGDFRKCQAPFLTGDPEVSAEQVKQVVNRTRKLVSGLLAAMGTVGETYAARISERLSPAAIKHAAEAEPGVFDSIEKKCWRKYMQIASEFSGPAVEKELLEIIKRYTEKFVLGNDAASDLDDKE